MEVLNQKYQDLEDQINEVNEDIILERLEEIKRICTQVIDFKKDYNKIKLFFNKLQTLLLSNLKDSMLEKDITKYYFLENKLIYSSTINNLLTFLKRCLSNKMDENQPIQLNKGYNKDGFHYALSCINNLIYNIDFIELNDECCIGMNTKLFFIELVDTLTFLLDKLENLNIHLNKNYVISNKKRYITFLGKKFGLFSLEDKVQNEHFFTYFILKLHRLKYLDDFMAGFIRVISKDIKRSPLSNILLIPEFKLISKDLFLIVLKHIESTNETLEELLTNNDTPTPIVIEMFFKLSETKGNTEHFIQHHLFKNILFKVLVDFKLNIKYTNYSIKALIYFINNFKGDKEVLYFNLLEMFVSNLSHFSHYNQVVNCYFVLNTLIKVCPVKSLLLLSYGNQLNSKFATLTGTTNADYRNLSLISFQYINHRIINEINDSALKKVDFELKPDNFSQDVKLFYNYLFDKQKAEPEIIEPEEERGNINNNDEDDPFLSDEEIESKIKLNEEDRSEIHVKEPRNLIECIEYLDDDEHKERFEKGLQRIVDLIEKSEIGFLRSNSKTIILKLLKLENDYDIGNFYHIKEESIVLIIEKCFTSVIKIILSEIFEDHISFVNKRLVLTCLSNVVLKTELKNEMQEMIQQNESLGKVVWKSKNLIQAQKVTVSDVKLNLPKLLFFPILDRLLVENNLTYSDYAILHSIFHLLVCILQVCKNLPEYTSMKQDIFNTFNKLRYIPDNQCLVFILSAMMLCFENLSLDSIYFDHINTYLAFCEDIIVNHTDPQLISLAKKLANSIVTQYQSLIGQ